MTGWLVPILLAIATFAGLWRVFRGNRGALQFLAGALLIGLAGFAFQGRPDLPGRAKPPPERKAVKESEFAASREAILGRFDRAWYWLNLAEARQRRGDTKAGVDIIRSALREDPTDPDLWVGLGNALLLHGDGMMSPAAQLAFDRASALAPDHPGPRFFYGLALAQSGRIEEAEAVWRALIAAMPESLSWRPMVEERLEMIDRARASGRLP